MRIVPLLRGEGGGRGEVGHSMLLTAYLGSAVHLALGGTFGARNKYGLSRNTQWVIIHLTRGDGCGLHACNLEKQNRIAYAMLHCMRTWARVPGFAVL